MPSETTADRRGSLGPARMLLAGALATVLVAGAPGLAPCAFADVRGTDEVLGQTVTDRGLSASSMPSIDAEYAALVGADGTVYFERAADTETNIASITKVMTAIVAIEHADLDMTVRVSEYAARIGESSAQLWPGDELTLSEALKAMMIPSGNDAAEAIAENVGALLVDAPASGEAPADEESLAAFVAEMNATAEEIGCTGSVFENPHGLDDGDFKGGLHSTAADVSLIVAHAMELPAFREAVCLERADIQVARGGQTIGIEVLSTDELLGVYEGMCGVKTGFTQSAGPCFAGACERDGETFYSVVLHSSSETQRFADTTTLFDWVFENRIDYPLAHSDTTIAMPGAGEVPVVAYAPLSAWHDRTVAATFADPSAAVEIFAVAGNVSQSFEFYDVGGAVAAGDVVGHARFYQRNELIAEEDVVACEDVPAPGLLEGAQTAWERFCALFTGEQTQAEPVVVNETPLVLEKG